jgi:recombination protein RecA
MAKKPKKQPVAGDGFAAELATALDGELAVNHRPSRYYIDTGNLAFNYCNSGRFISGGLPGGRITEIYGPSASAKSLVGMNCLFGAQKLGGVSIILDCENALNSEFAARASHVDISNLVRYTPEHLEGAFAKIHNVIRYCQEKRPGVPIVFLYDSVTSSPTRREFNETKLREGYTQKEFDKIVGSKKQPGERSAVISAELRKLTPLMEAADATLVMINQIRTKIGVMYGNPETTGGNWVEYYPSCRIRVHKQKKIENKKLKTDIGQNIAVKNVKSRACRPFMKTEGIHLFFDTGINPLSGLLTVLKQTERIEEVKKGEWRVLDAYRTDTTDYVFKGTEGNNAVEVQVLLDNPSLVDAGSRAEIEDYLTPFHSAMKTSASEDTTEVEDRDELSDDELTPDELAARVA